MARGVVTTWVGRGGRVGQRSGEATGMMRAARNYSQGKSSLEKKGSGTSVWVMQGLPVETVLEGAVHGNFFYAWVLDWTKSFRQSQCWEGQLRGDLGEEIAGHI